MSGPLPALLALASCALLAPSTLSFVGSAGAQTRAGAPAASSERKKGAASSSASGAATKAEKRESRGAAAAPLPVVREVDLAGLRRFLPRESGKGRPLLINFWATWCEPCREEFPDLVKIDDEYRERGLDFVIISLDDLSDIRKGVPEYLRSMHARMPAFLLNVQDPEDVIALVDPKWTGAMPATFLFDAQGTLVFKTTGRIKPDELRAAIEKTVTSDK